MTFYANNYSVIYTSMFLIELNEIVNYIAYTLKEPKTAKKFYDMVKLKTNSLHFFPEMHTKINHKNHVFRKLHVNKYLVIYEVDNNTGQVYILHIFHGSQNYFNQL